MPAARFLRCTLGAACLTAVAAVGRPADWPQWGGRDGRNMAADEAHLPFAFEPGRKKPDGSGIDLQTTKNVKWVARLGTETYSSPVVADGKVFIGTNDMLLDDSRRKPTGGGMLLCFEEATGRPLWRFVCPKLEADRDKVSFYFDLNSLGICSTPTVDGNRVYLVTNRCEVVCLDVDGMANGNDGPFADEGRYAVEPGQPPVEPSPADADVVWVFDMLRAAPTYPHDAANSCITVCGDFLYVATCNAANRGDARPGAAGDAAASPNHNPSIIVLHKKTGRMVAQDAAGIGARVFHGQWSSPSLGRVGGKGLVFYGGGDGICYAFEALVAMPDKPAFLKTAWSYDCNPSEFRFKDGKPIDYWDGDSRSNPENKDDGLFYSLCEIIATPVFHGNRVYVAIGQDPLHGRGKGVLHCIDAAKTGDISKSGKIWSYEFERSLSTVSIAGGLLFVADFPGRIHCLDLETGRPYWIHDAQSDAWGSTFVADGKVYLGTRKHLWVLAAAKEKQVLGKIALGAPIRSSPAAANGVFYVASQRYLWAVWTGDAGRKENP